MRVYRIGALAVLLAVGIVPGARAAPARVNASEADPAAWLRQVYALYLRAEKTPDANPGASTDIIAKRASKSLAALFKRDNDCVAKGEGVCALDWDFVVDGQDSQLSNIKVAPAAVAGDKATVTVTFSNLKTPCVNTYEFVRENGVWKVEDIETKSGKDAPIRIAKMFRDYDYNQ